MRFYKNTQMEAQKNMSNETLNKSEIISLMNVYLSEWCHRDELFWRQIFTYFYVTLFVTILPNITEGFGIKIPGVQECWFHWAGMAMAVIFMYISVGYSLRLRACSRTYEELMNLLGDPKYKRKSIKEMGKINIKIGRVFSLPVSLWFVLLMFGALVALACFQLRHPIV